MELSALSVYRTAEMAPEEIERRLRPPAAERAEVERIVEGIIARVREEGDAAVLDLTRQFDWPEATLDRLRVSDEEMERAMGEVDLDVIHAMTMAAEHIRRYHERQMPADWFEQLEFGLTVGQRHTPVDSAACYVPTRKASIPSSLLMSVIPAQVARVPRIVVSGPCAADGALPAGVLAAAHLLHITEIYRLGGAVAMAALALGTETFPKVDLLVGPANIYGTVAKKLLYGEVGVDGLYGPSEVVILADGSVPPAWVAADLLSQSEHGEDSQSVLITPDAAYAEAVGVEVGTQLALSPRAPYLTASLRQRGAIIIARDLDDAVAMANLLAPEHLEVAMADPGEVLPGVRHAGSILLGGYAPVPVGDYFAGPSHILPTGRSARFSGGVGAMTFLKRSSLISVSQGWLTQHGQDITTLAEHEGLDAHAEAIRRRAPRP